MQLSAKKIKCDLQTPCSNCVKFDSKCERNVKDLRTRNYSKLYVESLENRIAILEGVLKKIKGGESVELSAIDLDDFVFMNTSTSQEVVLPVAVDRDMTVYGPSAFYKDDITLTNNIESRITRPQDSGIDGGLIEQCLSNFFRWQYCEYFTFIHRESFLQAYLQDSGTKAYFSQPLLLAIMAVGAKLSQDGAICSQASTFYHQSKTQLFSDLTSSITTLQALLCLSFYDLAENKRSSAWLLSDIGIRMGLDIGFHLDPKEWNLRGTLTEYDICVRRRVFWSYYTADHFLSFMLGRPSLLKVCTSTVLNSENLPKMNNISQYEFFDTHTVFDVSTPLQNTVNFLTMADSYFGKIFTSSTPGEELGKFNSLALSWRSKLPPAVSWNLDSLKHLNYNPVTSSFRYNYYIVVLLFNRPFLALDHNSTFLSPREVCEDIINELHLTSRRFLKDYANYKEKDKPAVESQYVVKLDLFLRILSGSNWKIARNSFAAAKLKIAKWKNAAAIKSMKIDASPPLDTVDVFSSFTLSPFDYLPQDLLVASSSDLSPLGIYGLPLNSFTEWLER